MKERPILFSATMVRALLDGRKTQTRRPYKNRKHPDFGCDMAASELVREQQHVIDRICPYGQPSDRLYVRETWQHSNYPFGPLETDCDIFYRADYWDDPHGMDGEKSPDGKYRDWRPSIHMPRWASRINLEVTGVRLERLQDISEDDAIAEGTTPAYYADLPLWARSDQSRHQVGYRQLWESINGLGSWDANPWVWVIEFKCVEVMA